MYSKRLSGWKGILDMQRRFHKQKLENMPEKLILKDTQQKEHLKQQSLHLQQQNEKIKALKEEIAVLKIAMQSYSLYEKKYFDIKYRYDELKNNTGNF